MKIPGVFVREGFTGGASTNKSSPSLFTLPTQLGPGFLSEKELIRLRR